MSKSVHSIGRLLRSAELLIKYGRVGCHHGISLTRPNVIQLSSSGCSFSSSSGQTHHVIRKASSVAEADQAGLSATFATPGGVASKPANEVDVTNVDDPAYKKIDQSFENAKEAYMSRTNSELLRCLAVFQMCSVNVLVEKNKEVGIA